MLNHQLRRAAMHSAVETLPDLLRDTAPDGDHFHSSLSAMDQPSLYIALGVCALSCILYIPFLRLPLLPDDYLQITLARQWGPISQWRSILDDPLFRNRATSLIVTYLTDLLFPMSRAAFGYSSIFLHAVNGLLVYALGTARRIGWRLSGLMAIVFVLQERHHEAVIWYAALPELLVFGFSLCCLLLWIRWLRSTGPSIFLWASVLTCFLLAQLSKESAVALLLLMPIIAAVEGAATRRVVTGMVPIAIAATVYVGWVFSGRYQNHHFWDGTFALQWGFFRTLLLSGVRGLWVWGWISLIALKFLRVRNRALVFAALAWIVAALLPYSFLTYMTTVPSRHHYLAGIGYSLIVALALSALLERTRNAKLVAICILVIGVHHAGYLWTSKYRQFDKRSQPIEAFMKYVQHEPRRPIHVRCADYFFDEARRAAYLRLGETSEKFVFDPAGETDNTTSYCMPGPV
jgi:hypothetical protein